MKISEMPEWVLKYKTKGYTVRCNAKSCYCLYKVTSTYVPGSHPKTKYEYVGVIKEKEGLITPRDKEESAQKKVFYLEYGFSMFLYSCFKRRLQRSLFNTNGENAQRIIKLSIIQYMYGTTSDSAIRLTWIGNKDLKGLIEQKSRNYTQRAVNLLAEKVEVFFKEKIPNEEDRFIFKNYLLLTVVREDFEKPVVGYRPEIIEIAERYRIEL